MSDSKKYLYSCSILALILFFTISCERNTQGNAIVFSATPVISETDKYALVIEPYISFRDQPGDSGITMAHGRRGEIYELTGKKIIAASGANSVWVQLQPGWVLESAVLLYSNRERAQKAAAELD